MKYQSFAWELKSEGRRRRRRRRWRAYIWQRCVIQL